MEDVLSTMKTDSLVQKIKGRGAIAIIRQCI